MSFVAITSNQPRHREFINRLEKMIDLSLIIVVSKKEGDKTFVQSENVYFNKFDDLKTNIIECDAHQINSSKLRSLLESIEPKAFFVFGAPLLRKELFSMPTNGCINIHTGLVQHHRGVDSSYWAIKEDKPETIGVTLHYIDESIDAGAIIDQEKTKNIRLEDNSDDIFMKTCITGFDLLEKNMYNIIENCVKRVTLDQKGKLYQSKDMDFATKLEIKHKTRHVLEKYLNGNYSRSL